MDPESVKRDVDCYFDSENNQTPNKCELKKSNEFSKRKEFDELVVEQSRESKKKVKINHSSYNNIPSSTIITKVIANSNLEHIEDQPDNNYTHSDKNEIIRKSNRMRLTPLAFWKNERVVYAKENNYRNLH